MKTISQLWAERSAALDRAGNTDPFARSKLARELHVHFFGSVHDVLDTRGAYSRPGSCAKDFYELTGRISYDDLKEMRDRLVNRLQIDRMSTNTAFKVLPMYQDMLKRAQTQDDMDIPICWLDEFLRRELGGSPSPDYGPFKPAVPRKEVFNDRDGFLDDDYDGIFLTEAEQNERLYSSSESKTFGWLLHWQTIIGSPVRFERQFPKMGYRRANVEAVLKPVFDLDWALDIEVIGCVLDHSRQLLKHHCHESLGKLTLGPAPPWPS